MKPEVVQIIDASRVWTLLNTFLHQFWGILSKMVMSKLKIWVYVLFKMVMYALKVKIYAWIMKKSTKCEPMLREKCVKCMNLEIMWICINEYRMKCENSEAWNVWKPRNL